MQPGLNRILRLLRCISLKIALIQTVLSLFALSLQSINDELPLELQSLLLHLIRRGLMIRNRRKIALLTASQHTLLIFRIQNWIQTLCRSSLLVSTDLERIIDAALVLVSEVSVDLHYHLIVSRS